MASPNNPKSCEQLIREHSKARVLVASRKPMVIGRNELTGLPIFARLMTDADAIEQMVRQYR